MSAASFPNDVYVHIRSSLEITDSDLVNFKTLLEDRNRYVCLQLVTMLKEQVLRNKTAFLCGDVDWIHKAAVVFFASMTVHGKLVGGALFYPRPTKQHNGSNTQAIAEQNVFDTKPADKCRSFPDIRRTISLSVHAGPHIFAEDNQLSDKKQSIAVNPNQREMEIDHQLMITASVQMDSGINAISPRLSSFGLAHVYIDLLCTNTPGKGYGSLLLRHIEQFVTVNACLLEQRQPEFGPLHDIRLLPVSSARGFFEHEGFVRCEETQEMFKPLRTTCQGLHMTP